MKKILKYTSIIFLILVVIFASASYFIALKYEKEITAAVIGELNKQIETEVEVDDINFSILRDFPMASLEFSNVFIHSTKGFLKHNPKKDTLIWAKRMSLNFNLIDIYNGNYVLSQMQLKNAIVKMNVDKQGNDNFHFIKESNDSTSSKFSVNLNKVILNNVDYHFDNTRISNHFQLYAKQFVLSGNLSDDEFGLSTSGSLLLQKIELDGLNYLMYPNTSLNVNLAVNNSKVEVESGSLKIGDEYLDLQGSYWFNNQSYIDVKASSSQMTVKNILKNLPAKYLSKFKDFDASGMVSFELFIKGEASKNKAPNIEINAFVNNAELLNTSNNIPLKNLSFSAHYVSSASLIEFRGFKGQLYDSYAKGNFTIKDFLHPKISAEIELESNLKELKQFFELDSIQNLEGQVSAKINLKGRMASNQELTKNDIQTFTTSGRILVSNAQVLFMGSSFQKIHKLNAQLQLDNNNIIIDNLEFLFGNSNAKINGKAYNTLAFVLLENETLNINGSLLCDSLNMDDILKSEEHKTTEDFKYPTNIAARMEVKLNKFKYDKFTAQNVFAQIYLDQEQTQVSDFRMNTSEGTASGNIIIKPKATGGYLLESNSNLSNIDIDQIMYQLNDFGQKSISHKNIDGKLTAISQIKASLRSDLSFVPNDLELVSNFNVSQGQLKNYKPLYKLSKFVELSELEDVKFENFTNTIQVKNSTIYIPKMDLQSNAINLKMSGQHSFNNVFTYRMNILLSEILGRKARKNKKENQEFGFIEDDGKGRTSIYLLIEGKGDDVKIKYDTKSVKEHIKEGFQEEKLNIKTILNEEFGLFKKDSAVIKNKTKPKKKSSKENFQIEWEDE